MTALNNKSAEEIRWMLDDYGIKHGPVVDSTRSLYERKLREAMVKERKVKHSQKPLYRQEDEEVTYVHHRTPLRHEDSGYRGKRYLWSEHRGRDQTDELDSYSAQDSYYYLSEPRRTLTRNDPELHTTQETTSTARIVPLWVQVIVFLLVASFLYFVFSNMESTEIGPFNRLT